GVAHDFNNLLTIILGNLQLLARRLPPEDTRAARLVDGALQGATRGAALTARLLAFARLQDLVPRAIEPPALLDTLRPMLAPLLGAKITVEHDLPPDVWPLRADPNQMELALLNLASNARDAMPEGGRLRLAARNAWVDAAETTFLDRPSHPRLAPGAYVVLSVTDTGCGMDAAALARAADPFFTTKGVGKGTGLGLSMVHGFVEQSGGALQLSSRPGQGTTVEIWLPRSEEGTGALTEGAPTDGARVADSEHERGLRILLVDDDPLVLASTTTMLEELGHEAVRAVASGAEALDVLDRSGDFDLLLTDYMMPGMSGVELATRARALHPGLPVLLASGFAELDGLAGVTWPRLRKPFSLADLSAALAGV
ncbi:MAG: ATP-binding protein, partial [Acetobacteraceae bacterium]